MKKPKILKVMSTCLLAVAILVAAVLILTPKAQAATIVESGTCGANLTWTQDSEGTLTISGTGAMYNYDNPDYAYGYWDQENNVWVQEYEPIFAPWWRKITSVIIGDGVTSIGSYAFCYDNFSEEMTSLTIGNSVTSIGYNAFYCSNSYYDYYFPLTALYITNPSAWCNIKDSLDDQVSYDYCHILDADGNAVSRVVLDSTVTEIPRGAFSNCSNLTEIIIPDSVTIIGASAFSDCTSLASVTIPDSVTYIAWGAFCDCTSLTSVTIGDNVKSIGDSTFYNCDSLTSMTIPDSVTNIGNSAFADCYNLTDVYYGGTQAQWNSISIGSSNGNLTYATIHYNHVHDYTLLPAITVNPTCTKKGYIEYTCVFGETYRKSLPALGHTTSADSVVTPPTCTQQGYTTSTCSHCGVTVTTDYVDALGHNYTGPVGTVDPTCTEEGYTGNTCTRCNDAEKKTMIDSLGHKMILLPAVPATCEKSGLTVGTACQRCGLVGVAQKEVPALGGECDFFDDPYTCKKCGYVRDTIPSDSLILAVEAEQESIAYGNTIKVSVMINENPGFLGVNFDVKWDTAILELVGTDTTNADFNKVQTNVRNNMVVVTVGDPVLGVMYPSIAEKYEGTGKVVTLTLKVKDGADADATPKVYIERASYVKIGGASSDDVTVKSKNVHVVSTNHKHTPGAAATCTTDQICTHCFAVLDPAKGHKWVDATCTTPKTCSVCETTEGSALGHKTVVDKAVAPTCTTTGLTEGSHCSVCNEVFVAQKVVAALGHKVVVDKAVAPTCTKTGLTEGKHCSVCNEILVAQNVVPAIGGNCDYSADPSTCKHCGHVRANVEITGVTLRPTCSGLYFKGGFNFDEDLQVTQYGIAVSLYNRRPVADDSDSSSLYTIGENSVLISNILGGDGTGGKAWIFARAYALLEDGTYIYGQVVITNLQSVVETLDAQIFDGLGTKQKTALTDMYRQYTAAMQDWLIPKIKELV